MATRWRMSSKARWPLNRAGAGWEPWRQATQARTTARRGLKELRIRSASLLPAHIFPIRRPDVDLSRSRDLLLRIRQHLFPLRDPAGRPRYGEQHREDRHREPHRLVDQPRIEV